MKKVLLLIIIVLPEISYSQSLIGLEGFLNTPNAEINQDGTVSFGFAFFKREVLPFTFTHNGIAYYASLVLLPFIQTSFRFTKNLVPGDALGDRMLMGKIRLKEEEEIFPSIAIGVHDLFHSNENETNRFAASYLVITKNFAILPKYFSIMSNFGYGTDWISASSSQYVGIFGGFSFTFLNSIELMGEYDAERFNAGLRITLFKHIKLLGGFMDLKHFSGGAAVSWEL